MFHFVRVTQFCLAAITVCGLLGCTTYRASVSTTTEVRGLDVDLKRGNGAFWRVIAHNRTSRPAALLWDESAYVNTAGNSMRLISGNTRRIHTGQEQADSPIPPGATLNKSFVGEAYVEHPNIRRGVGDPNSPARIILVFKLGDSKQTYEASITFSDASQDID